MRRLGVRQTERVTGLAIEWGDVATWVSSVMTAVTLGLALYILLRDKRREEHAQVNRIFMDEFSVHKTGLNRLHVRLYNNSDQPIFQPSVLGVGPNQYAMTSEEMLEPNARKFDKAVRTLKADETAYWSSEDANLGDNPNIGILFTDARGATWAISRLAGPIKVDRAKLYYPDPDHEGVLRLRNPFDTPQRINRVRRPS